LLNCARVGIPAPVVTGVPALASGKLEAIMVAECFDTPFLSNLEPLAAIVLTDSLFS
jgi:hypothetical protein